MEKKYTIKPFKWEEKRKIKEYESYRAETIISNIEIRKFAAQEKWTATIYDDRGVDLVKEFTLIDKAKKWCEGIHNKRVIKLLNESND